MLGRHPCTAAIVDADRARLATGIDVAGDEGQAALPRQLHQPIAILHALDDKAVDQRRLDAPGSGRPVGGRDERHAGAALVAGRREADHEFAVERIVEEIGEVVADHDADGIDLAGPEQPAARVGPAIAELARRLLDPGADLGANQLRPAEDVGGGALGDTRRLRHVRQLHGFCAHCLTNIRKRRPCEPIQDSA